MQTIEYTNPGIDREGWPSGEWDDEPDKIQWRDETTGLPCLIVRNRMGGLCGYVGVSQGHRFYGVDYDRVTLGAEDEPYDDAHYPPAHGGLTFSNKCADGPENGTICHLPEADDFACIHEMRRWDSERNRQGVHGGDHRRGGVDQPRDQYNQENTERTPSDRSEARDPMLNDLVRGDQLAGENLGSGERVSIPETGSASQTSVVLEGEGRPGSGDSGTDPSVLEGEKTTSRTGNQSRENGGDFGAEARGRGDGNTPEHERADASSQRHPHARYCPDCDAIVSPDETYWLGFDCGHAFDLLPGMLALDKKYGEFPRHNEDMYRNVDYVKGNVGELALWLKENA